VSKFTERTMTTRFPLRNSVDVFLSVYCNISLRNYFPVQLRLC